MQSTFYTYASSGNENTLVDKHDILSALTAWSWLWICLEVAVILVLCGATAFLCVLYETTAWLFAFCIFLVFLIPFLSTRCGTIVKTEIAQIIANDDARNHVKKAFDAL